MSDYKEILYDKQRGGVLITLNRPEALNAITRPMLKEIHNALDQAEADPEIRAIVITGAGRAFSSGFDQATTSGRRRDIQWPQGIQTGMSAADLMNYWSVRVMGKAPNQVLFTVASSLTPFSSLSAQTAPAETGHRAFAGTLWCLASRVLRRAGGEILR